MPEPRHTTIDVPPGWDVEILRGPCACPAGRVCAPDDPFAGFCPGDPPRHREAST